MWSGLMQAIMANHISGFASTCMQFLVIADCSQEVSYRKVIKIIF